MFSYAGPLLLNALLRHMKEARSRDDAVRHGPSIVVGGQTWPISSWIPPPGSVAYGCCCVALLGLAAVLKVGDSYIPLQFSTYALKTPKHLHVAVCRRHLTEMGTAPAEAECKLPEHCVTNILGHTIVFWSVVYISAGPLESFYSKCCSLYPDSEAGKFQ